MRQRPFVIGAFLLVLALMVVGLGACSKSAEVRETSPTTAPVAGVTSGVPGVTTAAPGETVVSAVTPVPGTGVQPTVASVSGTPVVVQPQPTAMSQATVVVPTAVPSSGQQGTVVHTVQKGETLTSIAQQYGTTADAIADANNLTDPSTIYPGQKLTIPTSGSTSGGTSGGTSGCRARHTVQRGEWVWQIARNYGVSPYAILAANGLTIQTANTIYPGTVLCIP
jgi:LysM repeat protein